MALSHEDKKDVKGALGKAMANKISDVTRDSNKMRDKGRSSKPTPGTPRDPSNPDNTEYDPNYRSQKNTLRRSKDKSSNC